MDGIRSKDCGLITLTTFSFASVRSWLLITMYFWLQEGGCFHSRTAMGMFDHVREAVEKGEVLLEWDYSKVLNINNMIA